MPDITKCSGKDCPVKMGCYRYTSKPDELQAYFETPPFKYGKCNYYWGDNAESIWNQLNDIVNGKEK